MKLLILQHPGHNPVFYEAAATLALAELDLASRRMTVFCQVPEAVELGGVRYLQLETETDPTPEDWALLSRLSFSFALFQQQDGPSGTCLKPMAPVPFRVLDEKISSLLKYKGKTNETFTRLLISVALLSSHFRQGMPIRLLDPVAGRGTTLYEAALRGFDAFGVEQDPKAVHEGATFFTKFLERERIRHKAGRRRIAGRQKSDAVFIREWHYAPGPKETTTEYTLGMVQGDSRHCEQYFKKQFFQLIAGDLPYGVAHTSKSAKGGKSGSRNALDFVTESLPGWLEVLAPGGVLALAWNSLSTPRKDLEAVVQASGLEVLREGPYSQLEHRVDQSIRRDVLVARKPGGRPPNQR